MQVGFVGLGAMGLPMTRHLVEAGHDLTVASRSRGPIDAALAFGAKEGNGPREVVETSDVTILCVPNSLDVVEVLDAAMPALDDSKLVVDTSTIDPEVERAQHARVAATGARYLEAHSPVARRSPKRARSPSWSVVTRSPSTPPDPRSSPTPDTSSTSAVPPWVRW